MKETSEARFERRKGAKTYPHFQGLERMPSEYEVVSTRLTYNVQGFDVSTPVVDWYGKYRDASPLVCRDWDRFYDPRQTIYRRYNEIQQRQETYVDFVLERIDEDAYDSSLSDGWIAVLRSMLGPYRFPVHGLQMISAYVAHLAPSSRITNCAAFQAADEMRLVQRLAQRVAQLRRRHGGFGEGDRHSWEEQPIWQPLRSCLERMLVTWDWAEALVASNLVLKPHLDELYLYELVELAAANGDSRLGELFYSFGQDAEWHRAWSRALIACAVHADPGNRNVLNRWIEKWLAPVRHAIQGFAPVFEEMAPKPQAFEPHAANVNARYSAFLNELGLQA